MQMQPDGEVLTAVLGIRLLPAEVEKVGSAAKLAGLTKSQWLRQTIVRAVNGSPDTELLLGEIIRTSTVLVNMLLDMSAGKSISPERFVQIRNASETKYKAQVAARINGATQ